jgi:hypothetical protein
MGTHTLAATQARWTARPATLGAYVLSLAIGAGVGWTAHVPAIAQTAAVRAETSQTSGAATSITASAKAPVAADPAQAKGRSGPPQRLVLLLPGEAAFISTSRIAIAGLAHGRPHGTQIRTVTAELVVRGRVVAQTDLMVSAAQFAGFLELPAGFTAKEAVLRISDPTLQAGPAVFQRVRLDLG